MRKNAASQVTYLVKAHDVDPVETHLFVCVIDGNVADKPEPALRDAWMEWAGNDLQSVRTFIKHNGTNWGDAASIPEACLRKAGILKYENATTVNRDGSKSIKVKGIDWEVDVDHNESLFDLEDFLRDPPASLPAPKGAMCECCKTRPADRVYRVMGGKGKVIGKATYCRPCFKSVFAPEYP